MERPTQQMGEKGHCKSVKRFVAWVYINISLSSQHETSFKNLHSLNCIRNEPYSLVPCTKPSLFRRSLIKVKSDACS